MGLYGIFRGIVTLKGEVIDCIEFIRLRPVMMLFITMPLFHYYFMWCPSNLGSHFQIWGIWLVLFKWKVNDDVYYTMIIMLAAMIIPVSRL